VASPQEGYRLRRVGCRGDDLRPVEREAAYRLALEIVLRTPEAVFRSPEKLALAWE
jgi:hypothetical protein